MDPDWCRNSTIYLVCIAAVYRQLTKGSGDLLSQLRAIVDVAVPLSIFLINDVRSAKERSPHPTDVALLENLWAFLAGLYGDCIAGEQVRPTAIESQTNSVAGFDRCLAVGLNRKLADSGIDIYSCAVA